MSGPRLPSPYHGYEHREPKVRYERHEGRIDRAWRLMGESWRYLRAEPRLFALPALSTLVTTLAALAIFAPALYLLREEPTTLSAVVAVAVGSVPLIFIGAFFNVGFLAMVVASRRGERPTIGYGLRAASRRAWAILGWSVLSTAVGFVLQALRQLPGGSWFESLVGWLGGIAWALATFFVVPVLALERVGPLTAVKRSARAFRERWGEAVTGDISIGFIFTLLMIPGAAIAAGGVLSFDDAVGPAIALLALGLVLLVPPVVASSALTQLFTLELYELTTTGTASADGAFAERDLRSAIKPGKRRWWRRGR